MRERENLDINASASEKIHKIGRFQKKLGIGTGGVLAFMAIITSACGGDDSGDKDQNTATPFRSRVERTFTPTASPNEEATLTVTALPTPEPTPEPTAVYVPPLVTPRPTLRPTQIPTVWPTTKPNPTPQPTLEPTPVPTLIPPRPTPTPTPIPLEVCNTGRFTNPVDGQTVSREVDVRAQLAHDNDFSKGCSITGYHANADAIVIDNWGRRWSWVLYCGYTYPILQPDWECFRGSVRLSAWDHPGNDLELELDGIVVDGVELNY